MLNQDWHRYLIKMAMGHFAAPDVPKHVEKTSLSGSESDAKEHQKATKELKRKWLFRNGLAYRKL
jgi:hypothetical protein